MDRDESEIFKSLRWASASTATSKEDAEEIIRKLKEIRAAKNKEIEEQSNDT